MRLEELLNSTGLHWYKDNEGDFALVYRGGIHILVSDRAALGVLVGCIVSEYDESEKEDVLGKVKELQQDGPGKYVAEDGCLWFIVDLPGAGLTAKALKWAIETVLGVANGFVERTPTSRDQGVALQW